MVIIRGRNILKLNKLDYTKLPMAAEIHQTSIMDYCPVSDIYHTAVDFPTEQPARMEPTPKKRGLYRSARPPDDF